MGWCSARSRSLGCGSSRCTCSPRSMSYCWPGSSYSSSSRSDWGAVDREADAWSALAPLYDWEHAGFELDGAMYLGLARRSGGPILDAACGTGRVAFRLAASGYDVVGVDSSTGML